MVYTFVALFAFMGIGLGTYYYLGSPSLQNQPLTTRLAAIENLDVDDAVAKIEAQLQATLMISADGVFSCLYMCVKELLRRR